MLVFDTETRTDAKQSLTFGSYRFIVDGECVEEGLFHGDDLPERDRRILENYVSTHRADTVHTIKTKLRLLTRAAFVDRLYKAAYKSRCLLVGFNLPFDLSRVAFRFANARGRFAGGFSLDLWSYLKGDSESRDPHRPSVAIKHIDSKRALKGFTSRHKPDDEDLIPEGAKDGKAKRGYVFRGHFLDLRTLAFALTDRSYSLETACEAFGVEHGKQRVERHGEITEEYIDYNRRDVLASCELAVKLLEEYDRHPLTLQETKAYSPASIGKSYLRSMGITPILQRQPDFPKQILGYAQSAFFGGRTSAHVRKHSVPVVFTDFLSMYPTVNSLMGLWKFVRAREIRIRQNCADEIQKFLSSVKPADFFNPATWTKLPAFVRVAPDGDILPVRAQFAESNDWQIGVNHLYGDSEKLGRTALWYSLADVIASVILTGRVLKVMDAFRLEAVGVQAGLKPVKLRGVIEVDPRSEDFFKVVIEERKRLNQRTDLTKEEKSRLDKALKVLANSTSYGIYAEMNRQESDESVSTVCHGIDAEPFKCTVSHPDNPGEYCFPPLASLITGAARLMLALLEHAVTELGGTYAMEDTDSMAIVATEHGGLVPCPGGLERIGRKSAVRALSWKQVDSISNRFESLNPYDRNAVPGSVLKIEDYNFDPRSRKQRQIFCHAISAKRYCLFLRDQKTGEPILLEKNVNSNEDKWSEHGLGHLLNPTEPGSDDRKWMKQAWRNIVRIADRLPAETLPFAKTPAVGRVTISSPAVMRAFREMNAGKGYPEQVKPFNFVLTSHVNTFGHPTGTDPKHFHLIAPYETDPGKWLRNEWIDRYSGKRYRIATTGDYGDRRTARVKTFGEVLEEYEFHPESKCADSEGNNCDRQTVGLLQRRHVKIGLIKYIGKESNAIEDVDSGLIHSTDEVYTEYVDPRRDDWATVIRPALQKIPVAEIMKAAGISRMAVYKLLSGRSRPRAKTLEKLKALVASYGTSVADK